MSYARAGGGNRLLREVVGSQHGVAPESVMIVNGGKDEANGVVTRLWLEASRSLSYSIYLTLSYSMD